VLQGLGVRCIRAIDGQSALQAIRLNPLALALLDAKLTDTDGLELAKQLRKAQQSIPIVVISGYFYKDDPAIEEALKQGLIQGFIEKPFSHGDVVEIVKDALSFPQPTARKVSIP
jgi:CheY-like chemotaxis protein